MIFYLNRESLIRFLDLDLADDNNSVEHSAQTLHCLYNKSVKFLEPTWLGNKFIKSTDSLRFSIIVFLNQISICICKKDQIWFLLQNDIIFKKTKTVPILE